MEPSNLSIRSPQIRAYFEGKGVYIPTGELLYIHTHPLIKPNFLADLEMFVNQTSEYLVFSKMSGKPVERLAIMATKLGRMLPDLNKDNAEQALDVLRDVYRLCSKLTGTPGPLAPQCRL